MIEVVCCFISSVFVDQKLNHQVFVSVEIKMRFHVLLNWMNKSEPFKNIPFLINIYNFVSSELKTFICTSRRNLVRSVYQIDWKPVLIIKVLISFIELIISTSYIGSWQKLPINQGPAAKIIVLIKSIEHITMLLRY